MNENAALDRAHNIANAVEFSGDIHVNMLQVHGAAKCLSRRVRELEASIALVVAGEMTVGELADAMGNPSTTEIWHIINKGPQ